ncbi:MAG: peptide-methionine (S)-S-oxide reductase MsrA [Nitrospiria bacterium]
MVHKTGQKMSWRLSVLLCLVIGLQTSIRAETMDASETATFAGGCFWCMEHAFDEVEGIISTTSGYTDGHIENPTYEAVSTGRTGHAEAVRVLFNPTRVSYETLLQVYWRNIDPTVRNRQFCDIGTQYRAAIYYHTASQKRLAFASKEQLMRNKPFHEPIVTEIKQVSRFYPAEAHHQDYHQKNPIQYRVYRFGCGRDQRLAMLWK